MTKSLIQKPNELTKNNNLSSILINKIQNKTRISKIHKQKTTKKHSIALLLKEIITKNSIKIN